MQQGLCVLSAALSRTSPSRNPHVLRCCRCSSRPSVGGCEETQIVARSVSSGGGEDAFDLHALLAAAASRTCTRAGRLCHRWPPWPWVWVFQVLLLPLTLRAPIHSVAGSPLVLPAITIDPGRC